LIYLRPVESRPSKAMLKAFSAGFQGIDQRRCPAPVGSRLPARGVGAAGVAGYAARHGVDRDAFVDALAPVLTADQVARLSSTWPPIPPARRSIWSAAPV
jgi:hypothetical protein